MMSSEQVITSMNQLERGIDRFLKSHNIELADVKSKEKGEFKRFEVRYLTSIYTDFIFSSLLWWAPQTKGPLAPHFLISLAYARLPNPSSPELYHLLMSENYSQTIPFRFCVIQNKYFGISFTGRVDHLNEMYWRELWDALDTRCFPIMQQIKIKYNLDSILSDNRSVSLMKKAT
jgi:hypothetical protein